MARRSGAPSATQRAVWRVCVIFLATAATVGDATCETAEVGGPLGGAEGRVWVGGCMWVRECTQTIRTRALSQIRVLALGDSITTGGGYPVFVVSEATRREEGRALTQALADGDGQVSRRTRSSCLAPLPTLPTRFPGPSLSPCPPLPTCHPSLQGNTVAHTYTHTQERERASERESECARERE